MEKKKREECYCNTCQLPFYVDWDKAPVCPLCQLTRNVSYVSGTPFAADAKKFEWDDVSIKHLMDRLIKIVKPIAITDKAAMDKVVAEIMEENSWFKERQANVEKKFKWTDDLVREFVRSSGGYNMLMQDIDFKQFKAAHSQRKYPEGILRISTNNGYSDNDSSQPNYQKWCNYQLSVPNSRITKVKNSFGEVLAVGDETNFGKIYCFKIIDNNILVGADGIPKINGNPGIAPNMNDVHPKKNIYTTEDGHEMKHGETMYMVYAPDYKIDQIVHDQEEWEARGELGGTHCFKEKINAAKFVAQNKPRYSEKDVMEAMQKAGLVGHTFLSILQKKVFMQGNKA